MGILPVKPRTTVRQAISRHMRMRSTVRRIRPCSRSRWHILFRPIEGLVSWKDRKALRALIQLEPSHAHEAEEKLVYLLALMTANAAIISAGDVHRAIETLRPFSSSLANSLSRNRSDSSGESRSSPDVAFEPRSEKG